MMNDRASYGSADTAGNARIQKSFARGGLALTTFFSFFFYFDEGRGDPKIALKVDHDRPGN